MLPGKEIAVFNTAGGNFLRTAVDMVHPAYKLSRNLELKTRNDVRNRRLRTIPRLQTVGDSDGNGQLESFCFGCLIRIAIIAIAANRNVSRDTDCKVTARENVAVKIGSFSGVY
jgi:hypothetical protein